jgi:tetratricopeptide (TPR) repeat protein
MEEVPMKRISGTIATVAALVLISIPVIAIAQPSVPAADTMTARQARRAILASAASMYFNRGAFEGYGENKIDPSTFRFTSDTFEFNVDAAAGDRKVDLVAMQSIEAQCNKNYCVPRDEAGKQLQKDLRKALDIYWHDGQYMQDAKNFAAALNRLHVLVNDNGAAWNQFRQQAAAWRALATKPPLPDAVRIRRIAAEDAIKNSNPNAALEYYEEGLDLYPTWPEGWFNAALIEGQLGDYGEAVQHMQNYLELLPNAADAQAARDQIDLWQFKAGQQQPAGTK